VQNVGSKNGLDVSTIVLVLLQVIEAGAIAINWSLGDSQ
jgi:hypothetical protein